MSNNIAALNIVMSANTSTLQTDFSRAAEIARRGGNDMKGAMLDAANAAQHGFKSVAESMGLLQSPISRTLSGFGTIGLALGVVAGSGFAFKELVGKAVEMGASMADMSIKTGLSVESISRFSSVAHLAGTDMDTVAGLMKKLSISAVEATAGNKNLAAVYKAIGISVQELKTLAPDELMTRVAKAVQGLDPMVVQDVMRQIGGKSGSDALVFLRELNERFDETHAKISTQFAGDAKEFEDNIKLMTGAAKYLGVEFASKFIPEINLAVEAFRNARKEGEGFFASMSAAMATNTALAGVDLRKYKDEIVRVQAELDKIDSGEQKRSLNPFSSGSKSRDELEKTLAVLKGYASKSEGALANPLDPSKDAAARAALASKNNTAGDGFIQGLQAQIEKADQGKYAMLNLQAAEKGVAREAEPLIATLKKLDEARSAKFYEDALKRQNSDIDFQSTLIGRTSQEIEVLNIEHRNTIELQKQIEQITKTNGEVSELTIQRMTESTRSATEYQVRSIRQRQDAERGWVVGSSKSIQDYVNNASNGANNASTVFTNGFKNMEDAVVSFAMTGKLNFANFAQSIISDLIRIQARAAISGIAGGLGQMMGLGGYGSATEGSSNFIGPPSPTASANGNIFSGGNVIPFAKGGIVSSPTLFPMANGGTGLMGEAGTEGVFPLARDSSGKLGVKSIGASTAGNIITINVSNEAGGDGYEAVATAKNNDKGIDIEVMVRKALSKDLSSNGQISQQMSTTFGLRRSA
jgi:lambda family phage tail tape measure protein